MQFKKSALCYHKVCAACTQNMTCASSTAIFTIHGTLFRTLSICISMERREVSLMLKDIQATSQTKMVNTPTRVFSPSCPITIRLRRNETAWNRLQLSKVRTELPTYLSFCVFPQQLTSSAYVQCPCRNKRGVGTVSVSL